MSIDDLKKLGTKLDWQKAIIANKILNGDQLTQQERLKAAEWIVCRPLDLPEKKETRGRKKGAKDETIENALLFQELASECKTKDECYRKILEQKGEDNSPDKVEKILKSVKAGNKALATADEEARTEIGKSLARIFINSVMKD
ncbi:hypothetical protein [Geomonas ferrireducens]|uniref:hypothetical protein n=1 Tax=Geomonas ferrireducens TaxID=2570227 RepID=UPI0010A8EE54|nr:hypothetical protein [Geomonas ferrireducens]